MHVNGKECSYWTSQLSHKLLNNLIQSVDKQSARILFAMKKQECCVILHDWVYFIALN